jgi:hypothetical protein
VGKLPHWEQAFSQVGWFIPPYIQMGVLANIASEIHSRGSLYTQDDLERGLMMLYGPRALAAMVMHRYNIAPVIQNYRETIAEAVEAHFFGLDHIAVGGLIPVIEGAGRQLAKLRNLRLTGKVSVSDLFFHLADDCKQQSINQNMGEPGEVTSMMDSFVKFIKNYMYTNSSLYALVDRTNRHGISHGAYTDADYGRPLNFYKTIAAVDFLTFVASFSANISWLGPNETPESKKLAAYYVALLTTRSRRVR